MLVEQVGIPLEIDRGTGQAAPNVYHLLGEPRGEREMQGDSNWPSSRRDAPPAIEFLIRLQYHPVRCLDRRNLKRANQIEDGSEAVRPYFRHSSLIPTGDSSMNYLDLRLESGLDPFPKPFPQH